MNLSFLRLATGGSSSQLVQTLNTSLLMLLPLYIIISKIIFSILIFSSINTVSGASVSSSNPDDNNISKKVQPKSYPPLDHAYSVYPNSRYVNGKWTALHPYLRNQVDNDPSPARSKFKRAGNFVTYFGKMRVLNKEEELGFSIDVKDSLSFGNGEDTSKIITFIPETNPNSIDSDKGFLQSSTTSAEVKSVQGELDDRGFIFFRETKRSEKGDTAAISSSDEPMPDVSDLLSKLKSDDGSSSHYPYLARISIPNLDELARKALTPGDSLHVSDPSIEGYNEDPTYHKKFMSDLFSVLKAHIELEDALESDEQNSFVNLSKQLIQQELGDKMERELNLVLEQGYEIDSKEFRKKFDEVSPLREVLIGLKMDGKSPVWQPRAQGEDQESKNEKRKILTAELEKELEYPGQQKKKEEDEEVDHITATQPTSSIPSIPNPFTALSDMLNGGSKEIQKKKFQPKCRVRVHSADNEVHMLLRNTVLNGYRLKKNLSNLLREHISQQVRPLGQLHTDALIGNGGAVESGGRLFGTMTDRLRNNLHWPIFPLFDDIRGRIDETLVQVEKELRAEYGYELPVEEGEEEEKDDIDKQSMYSASSEKYSAYSDNEIDPRRLIVRRYEMDMLNMWMSLNPPSVSKKSTKSDTSAITRSSKETVPSPEKQISLEDQLAKLSLDDTRTSSKESVSENSDKVDGTAAGKLYSLREGVPEKVLHNRLRKYNEPELDIENEVFAPLALLDTSIVRKLNVDQHLKDVPISSSDIYRSLYPIENFESAAATSMNILGPNLTVRWGNRVSSWTTKLIDEIHGVRIPEYYLTAEEIKEEMEIERNFKKAGTLIESGNKMEFEWENISSIEQSQANMENEESGNKDGTTKLNTDAVEFIPGKYSGASVNFIPEKHMGKGDGGEGSEYISGDNGVSGGSEQDDVSGGSEQYDSDGSSQYEESSMDSNQMQQRPTVWSVEGARLWNQQRQQMQMMMQPVHPQMMQPLQFVKPSTYPIVSQPSQASLGKSAADLRKIKPTTGKSGLNQDNNGKTYVQMNLHDGTCQVPYMVPQGKGQIPYMTSQQEMQQYNQQMWNQQQQQYHLQCQQQYQAAGNKQYLQGNTVSGSINDYFHSKAVPGSINEWMYNNGGSSFLQVGTFNQRQQRPEKERNFNDWHTKESPQSQQKPQKQSRKQHKKQQSHMHQQQIYQPHPQQQIYQVNPQHLSLPQTQEQHNAIMQQVHEYNRYMQALQGQTQMQHQQHFSKINTGPNVNSLYNARLDAQVAADLNAEAQTKAALQAQIDAQNAINAQLQEELDREKLEEENAIAEIEIDKIVARAEEREKEKAARAEEDDRRINVIDEDQIIARAAEREKEKAAITEEENRRITYYEELKNSGESYPKGMPLIDKSIPTLGLLTGSLNPHFILFRSGTTFHVGMSLLRHPQKIITDGSSKFNTESEPTKEKKTEKPSSFKTIERLSAETRFLISYYCLEEGSDEELKQREEWKQKGKMIKDGFGEKVENTKAYFRYKWRNIDFSGESGYTDKDHYDLDDGSRFKDSISEEGRRIADERRQLMVKWISKKTSTQSSWNYFKDGIFVNNEGQTEWKDDTKTTSGEGINDCQQDSQKPNTNITSVPSSAKVHVQGDSPPEANSPEVVDVEQSNNSTAIFHSQLSNGTNATNATNYESVISQFSQNGSNEQNIGEPVPNNQTIDNPVPVHFGTFPANRYPLSGDSRYPSSGDSFGSGNMEENIKRNRTPSETSGHSIHSETNSAISTTANTIGQIPPIEVVQPVQDIATEILPTSAIDTEGINAFDKSKDDSKVPKDTHSFTSTGSTGTPTSTSATPSSTGGTGKWVGKSHRSFALDFGALSDDKTAKSKYNNNDSRYNNNDRKYNDKKGSNKGRKNCPW